MHSHPFRAALAAALLTALVPASAHAAKKKTDWLYDVTVRAEMTHAWNFHEEAHMGDTAEPCDRVQDAAGTAKIQLHSRRPTRVMVLRGQAGRPPMLDVGTGEGVPLTGSYRRSGKDEEQHSGPRCGPANPPQIQPTDGCGLRTAKGSWSLAYTQRGSVAPVLMFDELRENCPSGPPHGLEWEADVVPQIGAVTTKVPASKFYGTKQFTLRGSRTFAGLVPAINEPHFQRGGQAQVTWQWETTYRLVGKKTSKRKRR